MGIGSPPPSIFCLFPPRATSTLRFLFFFFVQQFLIEKLSRGKSRTEAYFGCLRSDAWFRCPPGRWRPRVVARPCIIEVGSPRPQLLEGFGFLDGPPNAPEAQPLVWVGGRCASLKFVFDECKKKSKITPCRGTLPGAFNFERSNFSATPRQGASDSLFAKEHFRLSLFSTLST